MTLEDILKALSDIAAANSMSWWIVGSLTALGFAIMRAMLPVKGLAVVFFPALFWGGLTGIYAAQRLGIVFSTERSAQIVVASTLGMSLALVIMVGLTHLVVTALRIRTPLTIASRARA